MARSYNFYGATKATGPSATIDFQSTDFPNPGPGQNLVELYLNFQATGSAGVTLADIDRLRLKQAGDTFLDINMAHYIAWIQRYSKSNYSPTAADSFMNIPLYQMDALTEEAQDICGFKWGTAPTVEIQLNAGADVGTVTLGWALSNINPAFYPAFYGNTLQMTASGSNQRFSINENGLVKGACFNTTGVDRARIFLSGVDRYELPGAMAIQSQLLSNVLTQTDPLMVDLGGISGGGAQVAAPGNSYWLFDTNVAWAGTANEGSIYALRPMGV